MIKTIHPFPARMGPDLAVARLNKIKEPSVVLDPMAGSGTVLRHAAEMGHTAIGRDLDPLALLMTKVWTTTFDDVAVEKQHKKLMNFIDGVEADLEVAWIDNDQETADFVDFWFGNKQKQELRKFAVGLKRLSAGKKGEKNQDANDVLRLALSRIIITKDSGASLGRDVSHSRPHKVGEKSEYDVRLGFERSLKQVRERLASQPPKGSVTIKLGDARYLLDLEKKSVDVVLSSPPYLNAIDYMRGHRLSLVWLGYQLEELRRIRSMSVGTERGVDKNYKSGEFDAILEAMGEVEALPSADQKMVQRYAEDMYRLMAELARVLRDDGRINLVIGDSCLRGVYIENSAGFAVAGKMVGLKVTHRVERELPTRKRYLPMPKGDDTPLGKRMRSEIVLTLKHK